MTAFKHIPFFRICIPFVAGILVARFSVVNGFQPWMLGAVLACAAFFILPSKSNRLQQRAFLFCADVFLFCFAISLLHAKQITNDKYYFGKRVSTDSSRYFVAEVVDLPETSGRYKKCELKVLQVKDSNGYQSATGKMFGYFKSTANSPAIHAGNILVFRSRLMEIEPPKNPFEFDYKNYLANRQVHYLSFIDSSAYFVTSLPATTSVLWQIGLRAKQHILVALEKSGLTANAYSISAALLTGYSHGIDDSVMQAFAHSGTLHVLSVSGLHTGLIYLMLAFLFDQFDRRKKYKILKFSFITVCLWLFALVTGFSAPVLRAVIMFNLLGVGKIFFRNDHRNQLNILCVSAFLLLCYDPFLLFDIGFQLSYFAMFGILFFQPVFIKIWQPQNRINNYIWQSVSASFAATLATLPFTLFYFKQFPLWFFICNIFVVPATFVILLLAALIVLKFTSVSVLINAITSALISFINLFGRPGTGFIDNIHFDFLDALILSFLIILISTAVYYRSFRYAVISLLLVLFLQINGIISSLVTKNENLFSVYHINKKTVCGVKRTTEVIIDSVDNGNYNYHIKPHLVSFNYPSVKQTSFNYVSSGNKTIIHLTSNQSWPVCNLGQITHLIVSNNCVLGTRDLQELKNIQQIIADGSNNYRTIKKLSMLCNQRNIKFYDTRLRGAYVAGL